ncbi:hypothetical protein QBZ16_001016 [Prototheca wickerhamii]|uniref:protein-serine/threonine phosphatase n=1 Tax=Prototheca wickerhamii TaxID=3111 RepID=A0AAD9IH23_PROWI|nr:hypothetical protein QBZ16_001016 [Prototheca wickerhamii]
MEGVSLAERQVCEASKAVAEQHKEKANAAFKAKHYREAVDEYTAATEADPSNPIYLSNRSFAHLRLEEFGAALVDASKAIELDPTYVKAYYRRGDAAFALARFKDAIRDFRAAARLAPRDPDVRKKVTGGVLAEAEKQQKRIRFEEALSSGEEKPVSETIVIEDVALDSSRLWNDMVAAFRDGRQLARRYMYWIVLEAQRLLRALPSLVEVAVPAGTRITVCGDTHGQFFDVCNIFELAGKPSEANPFLFNGDFVDRGSWSVEVILTLFAYKCLYPDHMHLTRGNHEAKSMNLIYGFYGEVREKCGPTAVEVFRETFCWLPLGYVLDGKPPDAGHMCEMMWSDPRPAPGREPNARGVGIAFGPDVTRDFLERNGLSLLVRSHEVKDEGYEVAHDGYCVTIFSAPNYCDQMGNKGAYITFEGGEMAPHFTQFDAVPHPDVKPMKYAGSMMNGMFGM